MCQKQVNTLMQYGVSVDVKNNNNHLICQKGDMIVDYYPTRECWFVRGDSTKYFGFDNLVKQFKEYQEVTPTQNQATSNQISADKLTLLDYFATHAMEGMVTDVVVDPENIAKKAYQVAYAMMKEREVRRG